MIIIIPNFKHNFLPFFEICVIKLLQILGHWSKTKRRRNQSIIKRYRFYLQWTHATC